MWSAVFRFRMIPVLPLDGLFPQSNDEQIRVSIVVVYAIDPCGMGPQNEMFEVPKRLDSTCVVDHDDWGGSLFKCRRKPPSPKTSRQRAVDETGVCTR